MQKLADISAFESLAGGCSGDVTVFNGSSVLSRGVQNQLAVLLDTVDPGSLEVVEKAIPQFDSLWAGLSALLASRDGVQLDADKYSNDYVDMKLMNIAPPTPMPKIDDSAIMGGVKSFLSDALDPQQADIMMSMINYNVGRVMSKAYADLLSQQANDWERANGPYFAAVPLADTMPEKIIDFDNNTRWV